MSFEFLGSGIVVPFQRDKKSDFANDSGVGVIKSNICQILGTAIGELPWRGSFGSALHRLRFRPNDEVTQELARVYVVDALKRWDPRIQVTGATFATDSNSGIGRNDTLIISITYRIVSDRGDTLVDNGTASVRV